ncbi:MAG: phytanoyl-CoA dioxygenase family protein [Maricaulaceae bacterium]
MDYENEIAPWLGGRTFDAVKADYDRDGYIIFNSVLSAEELEAIRAALTPYLESGPKGRNDFEGLKSNRVYALLAKHSVFANLAIHPLALAFAETDLGASCLLSSMLAIKLHPGETAQPWHHDDSHCALPRPRQAFQTSAFWAIDGLTEDNGATEFLPQSHLWGDEAVEGSVADGTFADKNIREVSDDPGARADALKAVMPAGSVMLAKGTLWHRGGANRSTAPRTIITPQYCSGFMRPLETMTLVVPPKVATELPKRAQELCGYSIHPPFMGYVDGVHPKTTFENKG